METQWLTYYTQVKRELLDSRRQERKLNQRDVESLQQRIAQLERSLRVIKESPMEYEISSSEIVRRQVICENLKKMLSSYANDQQRNEEVVAASAAGGTRVERLNETANPMTSVVSDRAVVQRQQEVIRQQDMIIGDIERGVDRLHGQAQVMNAEVRTQNVMIDTLEAHVDVATVGLEQEARHAAETRRKGQVCFMYICIGLEVVILLILILIFFVGSTGKR